MLLVLPFLGLFLLFWAILIPAAPVLQRALTWVGSRTARLRYRDYVPVALLLLGGVFAAIFVGDEFLDLAELVHENSPVLREFDARAHEWARTERTAGATLFFTVMTYVGTPVALGIIVTIVVAVLVARGRFRWAAYLALTSALGSLLVVQLKLYYARARPDLAEALRNAHGYSFPSGHAMGSTIVCLAFAYLALRMKRPWKQRAAAIAGLLTVICAISFSRVYLGVHWISDIGAGVAAGTVWVAVTTVAYEASRRIRAIRAMRAKAAADSEDPPVTG